MNEEGVLLDTQEEMIEELEAAEVADQELSIESLAAERDQLVDQLQRSVAEFQNYRRRQDADRLRLREIATQDVMRSVLPLVDDLQRAIAAIPEADRETGLAAGITAIERKFLGILERNGVTPVGGVGESFDPALHEAVATDESGVQTHIVEVYQTGYRQGDIVLRPAMVKVGQETIFNA
jgi:molecular chaperone GrpE